MSENDPDDKPVLPSRDGERKTAEVLESLKTPMEKRFGKEKLASWTDGGEILLVAIKDEERLEVWKKGRQAAKHAKIMEFDFTANSGRAGPKLAQGDRQIPEGVYSIEYLNPNSAFHLSLKVNYPNAFDRARAREDGRTDLGGDIMIHGNQVTVGCIPLGDARIEELFYLIGANGYRNTRVVIAPVDFRKGKEAPKMARISWEEELYEKVEEALKAATK